MIFFSKEEVAHIQYLHNDALLITVVIAHLPVHKVLLENGSSVNIIFKKALDQLRISSIKLKLVSIPLIGFTEASMLPLGMSDLPLCVGEAPNKATQMTNFMVIGQFSVYNVIVGRLALNAFYALPSTYHMLMKFPTTKRMGVVKRDQTDAWQCYVMIVKNSCHLE